MVDLALRITATVLAVYLMLSAAGNTPRDVGRGYVISCLIGGVILVALIWAIW